MKKQSASRSAFFNPGVLIGFVLCSIGVLLALTGSSESVTGNPAATSAETQNALFSLTAGTDNTAIGASALFRGQRATTKQSAVADPLILGSMPVATLSNSDEPASGCWTATGSLNTARYYHTATLLPNGKVLVVGGWDGFNPFSSAELYDPEFETWTATGSLHTARRLHTATLLPNGMVLVAGGRDSSGQPTVSAELYDPASETWTVTGDLNTARWIHKGELAAQRQGPCCSGI